jgi:large subunit ribosomal protein L23
MREPQEIIQAPLVTEKGSLLGEKTNQILFRVKRDANKIEVKQAVEILFKVKVTKVRLTRYLGKIKRVGRKQRPPAPNGKRRTSRSRKATKSTSSAARKIFDFD